MKRRDFVKKLGVAGTGSIVLPYIIPSGRLFAATGARKVNHVVLCIFGGGVRNLETVHKTEGNLMPNSFTGTETINSTVLSALSSTPTPTKKPLQTFGTLFKEFRYKHGPTEHYNGYISLLTGAYTNKKFDPRERPQNPTIFEFYNKYNSPSKISFNTWFVNNPLGYYPALNHSRDFNYGKLYGGNYIQPLSLLKSEIDPNYFKTSFLSSNKYSIDHKKSISLLINNSYFISIPTLGISRSQTHQEVERISSFLASLLAEAKTGAYHNPWNISTPMNHDMYNIFFTEKIIQEFKPELIVVDMQGMDIGHSNFTAYCNNIRKADFALRHLWQTIQSTPGMANDTILIVVPEIGRNATPNSIVDSFGQCGLDHSEESSSRELFCLIAGPAGVVKQNQTISTVTGESIDIVPTIAHILGYYNDIPINYRARMGNVLNQAFN